MNGTANLVIPPSTPSGTVLRLEGLGAVYLNRSGRGDLLLKVQAETPSNTSDKEYKRCWRMIQKIEGELGKDALPQKHKYEKLVGDIT